MNNNRKFLLWGSIAVILLAALIVFLFVNLSSDGGKGDFVLAKEEVTVYNAIPGDAVVIVDLKSFGEYASMVGDTLSFLYGLPYKDDGLALFQQKLLAMEGTAAVPVAFSLHYSAKNSVSFLQIMQLDKILGE